MHYIYIYIHLSEYINVFYILADVDVFLLHVSVELLVIIFREFSLLKSVEIGATFDA
jgi:hypothetical protein